MARAVSLGLPILAAVSALALPARASVPELPPALGEPTVATVEPDDTLLDIAFRHRLGFLEVTRLNPELDVWLPPEGTRVELPTRRILPGVPHEGLVINIPEMRLYDFTVGDVPEVFAIAIGDAADPSPLGEYRIGVKHVDPVWVVPESIRSERPELPQRVDPGPENPLGAHWMNIGASSYGIHGTNNRWSIGRLSTHGCIRLYNEEMQRLFARTPSGTPVRIIYEPVKIGRSGDDLVVEVHPDVYTRSRDLVAETLVRLLVLGLLDRADRAALERAIEQARGIPVPIGSLAAPERASASTY